MLYELDEDFLSSDVLTNKDSLFNLDAIVPYLETILISYKKIYLGVYKWDKAKLEIVNNITYIVLKIFKFNFNI